MELEIEGDCGRSRSRCRWLCQRSSFVSSSAEVDRNEGEALGLDGISNEEKLEFGSH